MADFQHKVSEESNVSLGKGCTLQVFHVCSVLPKARQHAEANVAATLEELNVLRARTEENEEELCGQVAMLKEQLLMEQSRSDKMQTSMKTELEAAQKQIGT